MANLLQLKKPSDNYEPVILKELDEEDVLAKGYR